MTTSSESLSTGAPRRHFIKPSDDRGVYLIWLTVAWVFIIVGFLADLTRYFAETPAPPMILHLHGLASFAWLALVTVQAVLVERNRVALHRTLGWWVVAFSVALIPLTIVASLVDQARQMGSPTYAPQFLSLEVEEMLTFAGMITAGVIWRKSLAAHKRFMMLAMLALMDAGPGRISDNILHWTPNGPLQWWAHYYWGTPLLLAAMFWSDWRRHKRVEPSLALGAAALVAVQVWAALAYYTPSWHDTAANIVQAWGRTS